MHPPNLIRIDEGANITSQEFLSIEAIATSHQAKGGRGVYTYAKTDSSGLGVDPESTASTQLNFTNAVEINRETSGSAKTKLESVKSSVYVVASNNGLHGLTDTGSDGKGAGGASVAESTQEANLHNLIWVDQAILSASSGDSVYLRAWSDSVKLYLEALAELYAAGGMVKPVAKFTGTSTNQIRSRDTSLVETKGNFKHIAEEPMKNADIRLKTDYNRVEVKILWWTATLTVEKSKKEWNWQPYTRCDFCDAGKTYDVQAAAHDATQARMNAFAKAMAPINAISRMTKVLAPINDIHRMKNGLDPITKAQYGEEDHRIASAIYALDLQVMLNRDVTLVEEQLQKYILWTDAQTQHNVYLLHNADRLYRNLRLDYVSEVIAGDVRNNGEIHNIEIFTALNSYAFSHPVIPIGSTGSLDFSTGIFTLPALADYELYLHEVSGIWLLERMNSGFFRLYAAYSQEAGAYAIGPEDETGETRRTLPSGSILEGMTEEGEINGWKRFWLGHTPDTASDGNETLIFFLWNEETDEIKAFRTSVNMLSAGEEAVEVSLYLFRDSKSDRRGEEKYNVLCFDTPKGEKSLVKIVTDTLENRELEVPRTLRITLRGFGIGADYPAYSLTDQVFVMMDGTDGEASLFDGDWKATFDGDVFESDYLKVEGIVDNNLIVTIKKGQPIWLESTGADTPEVLI